MQLIKVTDRRTAKEFLNTARILYKDDKNWICPLDSIIDSIFDPKKNNYYNEGEAIRWILKDDKGRLVGRVAAFYHRLRAYKYDPPAGGMGFFECINDRDAAFQLFDACQKWLTEKGMGAMDGPVNFGENDNFTGLLVEGFTPPAFGMNYNHAYYQQLFEDYGFRPFFEQESKHLNLRKPFPERFWKIAEWVLRKPGYTFEHIRKKDIDKFAADIVEIYNKAWVYHEHFAPLDIAKVKKGFQEARQILIEEFIWFVYHDGQPIALLVMLPDMNRILQKFKGRMTLRNKILFYFLKNSKRINRARITIMGVIPKFQGIGIESAIFWHLRKPVLVERPHYKELEISWVGDFNPKMKATLEALGADPGKIHITYRKFFENQHEFKKASDIPSNKLQRKTNVKHPTDN